MHVIITLAGHSRRFKEAGYALPKFLIPIDGMPMIEHVVNMFDASDDFHFVVNHQQIAEHPEIMSLLTGLAKKTEVVVIDVHELGPAYSALQVTSIPEEEPVIISYCDFLVRWHYQQFLRTILHYDAAIPAFRGFHPASFGHTHYAYMRVNEQNEMLELQEKQSFTPHRHQEFASTGIYYFNHWHRFKHYTQQLLQSGFGRLKEAYVSLLSNLMVADQLKIKVTEVENFICWGTPEDLAQYYFWSRYFRSTNTNHDTPPFPSQINLIPMAGKGSRFRHFGYRTSKPLIQVRNQPMIVAACHSFPKAAQWIFLPRADDLQKHPIDKALKQVAAQAKIIPVDYDTSGQAATCLLAKADLAPDAPLFIASCDYETHYSEAKWQMLLNDPSIDGVIWTCRVGSNLTKDPKAFAYCVTDTDGLTVTKIVEKEVISATPGLDPLVVGSFWFRKAADFIYAAETAIAQNIHVNGEHYVANSINLLIARGKRFVIFDIEQWISYGDPFELQIYHYWEEFFTHYQLQQLKSA